MEFNRCEMASFVVIGKEGSTKDGEGFIQRLWEDANSHFEEVAHLAKKDEDGNIVGVWGAMSDFTHSFQPWENGFSEGLYLAGVECVEDAEAPQGWTKWIIPAYEYIYVENEGGDTFGKVLAYLQENDLELAGAVHDFNCPQTGKGYMFFPVKKLYTDLPIPTHLRKYMSPTGEENNEYQVTGLIQCVCGQEVFEVYESNDRQLVKLRCKTCGEEILLLDAGKHGWNGFVCKDDFLDRSQLLEKYGCQHCEEDAFRVAVRISSQGKQDFLEECIAHDDSFKAEDWVDAFEWITVSLTCEACGEAEEDWMDLEVM